MEIIWLAQNAVTIRQKLEDRNELKELVKLIEKHWLEVRN